MFDNYYFQSQINLILMFLYAIVNTVSYLGVESNEQPVGIYSKFIFDWN